MTEAATDPKISDPISLGDKPVKRGEEVISSVRIRKPDSGALRGLAMRQLSNGDFDQHMKLLPRVTLPPLLESEIAQLECDVQFEMINEVVYFLLPSSMKSQLNPSTS